MGNSRKRASVLDFILEKSASYVALKNRADELENKVNFLVYENLKRSINERKALLGQTALDSTKASFDYQWTNFNEGKYLFSDDEFMNSVGDTICSYTNLPKEFFKGKKVADVGCGMGRFTYGLLSLGAEVTAMDQSLGGLQQVKERCGGLGDYLTIKQIDLVKEGELFPKEEFDIVYCYGVVHHTGNTYLAMDNVCSMVKKGGKVFMMIYGYPDNNVRFGELVNYEKLRNKTMHMAFEEKIGYLSEIYPQELVHGYFDAISPEINDILSFEEIQAFMKLRGFVNITRTNESDNYHFVAEKPI